MLKNSWTPLCSLLLVACAAPVEGEVTLDDLAAADLAGERDTPLHPPHPHEHRERVYDTRYDAQHVFVGEADEDRVESATPKRMVGIWTAAGSHLETGPGADPEISMQAEPPSAKNTDDSDIPGTQAFTFKFPPRVPSPPNYGHYCSMSFPGGGWAFASDSGGGDPCGYIDDQTGGTGTVERAGMYARWGKNRVVTRCSDGNVFLYSGYGGGPLSAAYDAAVGHPGCIHTVAPVYLPIFGHPFDSDDAGDEPDVTPTPGTGFDFAHGQYGIDRLNTVEFGWQWGDPGYSWQANRVDRIGRSQSNIYIDDHDGWDWGASESDKVYALAPGVVIAARFRDTGCTNGTSPIQGEVMVRYTIGRTPSRYGERFVVGYFHMDHVDVSTGDYVYQGTQIGEVGQRGCADGPHLHADFMRETNVASALSFPVVPRPASAVGGTSYTDGNEVKFEPFAWANEHGFDPTAWRGFPDGAISINVFSGMDSGDASDLRGPWGNP